jgi:hypothetical protein
MAPINDNSTESDAQEQRDEKAWQGWLTERAPANGAKAIIVAEYVVDKCRANEDYYGTATKRRILLAWSKSPRANLKECRKAAALYVDTVHLAGAGKDAEHRENYSMGLGTYLKAGGRYDTGWEVRKEPIVTDAGTFPRLCEIPEPLLSNKDLMALAAMVAHECGAAPRPTRNSLVEAQTGIPQVQPDNRPLATVLQFPGGERVKDKD